MTMRASVATLRGLVCALLLLAFVAVCGACKKASPGDVDTKEAKGAVGSSAATDAAAPARIVSVGGPVTEIIYALGAGADVVGVDTSSVFPDAALTLPKVGYQRSLAAEGILSLRPTMIIASADAGPPAVLEQLRSAGVRVEIVSADPTVEAGKERIRAVAKLLARDGEPLVGALERDLARAQALVEKGSSRPKVLAIYARGAATAHVLGKGTAGEYIVALAGGENVGNVFEGSKPMTAEAVVQAAPDFVLIPSRGLESVGGVDGLAKMPGISETPAGRAKRFVTMDDLLMLGFGPRTGLAVFELGQKLHPELASASP